MEHGAWGKEEKSEKGKEVGVRCQVSEMIDLK
jgi:hypothetical protein